MADSDINIPQSNISFFVNFLVYSDAERTNDPLLRDIDYKRGQAGIPTGNFDNKQITVAPGQTSTVSQTNRSLTLLTTSQFRVVSVADDVNPNRFRLLWVPGITSPDPLFRTRRTLASDSTTRFDVTVNNGLATFTYDGTGTDPNFGSASIQVGDILRIENDGPFNSANWGSFEIVSVDSTSVTVKNADAIAENDIVLGADIDTYFKPFDIFSSDKVQIGDELKVVSTAFNILNRGVYSILNVTPSYVEFDNSNPGIEEGPISLGSTSGIVIYPDIWSWLYLETDQDIVVRINADTSDNLLISPISPSDPDKKGVLTGRMRVYQLALYNPGINSARVKIALAE